MNFTIDQILNLSQQGFSADQIKAFDSAYTPQKQQYAQPVQPVQQYAQPIQPVQPVQPVQPIQQYAQPVQPVQPVQQYAQPMQTQPVQQYAQPMQTQPQPTQNGASMATDTSMQMLNLVKAMQEQALAGASGHVQKPETAVDASLDILGRGGNK